MPATSLGFVDFRRWIIIHQVKLTRTDPRRGQSAAGLLTHFQARQCSLISFLWELHQLLDQKLHLIHFTLLFTLRLCEPFSSSIY